MDDIRGIDPTTLQRLQERASQAQCSVDDLLNRWLDTEQEANGLLPYRHILDHTSDVIALYDLGQRHVYINGAIESVTGIPPAAFIGRTNRELGSLKTHDALWDAALLAVIQTGSEHTITFEYPPLIFETRLMPIIGDDGAVQYVMTISRDITEHKQTENALRQSEGRLRATLNALPDMMFLNRADSTYLAYHAPNVQHLAAPPDTFVGKRIDEVLPPEQAAVMIDAITQVIATRQPQTFEYPLTIDDRSYVFEARMVAVSDDETLTIVRDVTERKQAESQLQLQRRALETAVNAIVITDRNAAIQWANPAFTTLTGYTLEEVCGRNPNVLLKSGVHDEAFYAAMWRTILAGKAWMGKLINRRKDGSLYTEEQTITPVTDENGNITNFIGIKQDVTERERSAELALEKERLTTSLKKEQEYNETVRNMVASLAHDLRTPLAIISTSRDMLSLYFDQIDIDRRREKLDTIGTQLHYVAELLNDLTLVAGNSLNDRSLHISRLNLAALCQVIVHELQESAGSDHALRFVTDGQVQFAQVDEVLISRTLLNLLSNAIKYSPPGSEIRLELEQQADRILLRVVDQGIGISESDMPHIFKPFYRVADVRSVSGAGLGLSIVQNCVRRHNGTITVDSTPGRGTTFTVELPLTQS